MTSSEQWTGRHWPVPAQGHNSSWLQMHAAGGRRFERLIVWRHVWAAAFFVAAAATAISLVGRAAASAGGSPFLALVLSAVVVLLLADVEARCYRSYQQCRSAASRFVELYRVGEHRELSMEEENELWAIASRRLRFCPLQTMFRFQHGTRPAEDAFLTSAYWYLLGGRPQLVRLPADPSREFGRRAS